MPIIVPSGPEPVSRPAGSGGVIAAPHIAVPFTITRDGVATVEQDTPQEIANCVYNICVCPRGYRDDQPSFGIPDPTFGPVPVDVGAIESAIEEWEPRADLTIHEQAEGANRALRKLGIEVS